MRNLLVSACISIVLLIQTSAQESSLSLFIDVAEAAGVAFEHEAQPPMMPLGTGVAFADYDNDGWLDIYVTNQGGANALYHNEGDGTFTDVASDAGVIGNNESGSGAIFADYDNDGWRDLFVVNMGANILYHNNGEGTFTDVTDIMNLGDIGFGQSAVWGDYDNDGFLDLYVANHINHDGESLDKLYHNDSGIGFTDVSYLLSERIRSGAAFVPSFTDYDMDGDVDIYVVNDDAFGEHRANVLWRNDGQILDDNDPKRVSEKTSK